jgi:hypothetical protein
MTDMARIAQLLRDKELPIAGEIVSNPSTPNGYFVPLRLKRLGNGGKSPSGRTLALARSSLLGLGYRIDFILIDEEARHIEESLRASLLSSFPHDVRNSFFSSGDGHSQAWIEFKGQTDAETMVRLEEHIRKFAEVFSLKDLTMIRLGDTEAATKIETLSAIRQLAPVNVATLMGELVSQGLGVPSQDWMNRRLDALRRSYLVLRRGDGTYVLTAKALTQLGTRKDRRSPDVRRFLAIARQGS